MLYSGQLCITKNTLADQDVGISVFSLPPVPIKAWVEKCIRQMQRNGGMFELGRLSSAWIEYHIYQKTQ